MRYLKKLWARFVRYVVEENARQKIIDETPSDKQLTEMYETVKDGLAKINKAAASAGIL